MNDIIERLVNQFNRNRENQHRYAMMVCVLSLFVIIGVVWKLHGVGISMTSDVVCGIEEHQHTEECYENELLMCGKEEHLHTPDCLAIETTETEETSEVNQIDSISGEVIETEVEETTIESEAAESEEPTLIEETAETEPVILEASDVQSFNDASSPTTDYSNIFIVDGEYNDYRGFHPDDIYVATAINIRYKNNLNEYLYGANDGKEHDNNYCLNNADNLYWVHPNNTITLVAYTQDPSKSFYITTQGAITASNITTNTAGTVNVNGTNYYVSTTTISFGDTAADSVVSFSGNNFYIRTRTINSYWEFVMLSHADIEISDGGIYYAHTKQNINSTGYRIETITKYTSFVSKVNYSVINGYVRDNLSEKKVVRFESTDYTNKNNKTDDSDTQYELTSQKAGADGGEKFRFSSVKIDDVTFNIDLSLVPESIEIYRYNNLNQRIDINGNVIADNAAPEKVNMENSNVSTLVIKEYSVTLSGQSITDAENKCPNHSGLDFNIASVSKEINIEPPAEKTFVATKVFNHNGTDIINSNPQTFQLYDDNGNLVQEVQTVNGQIKFDTQYFATPGTYTYHIKEKIPAGAQQIAENKYFKDGVTYDSRVIDAEVTVELQPSIKDIFLATGTTYNGATLVPSVKYSINGVEITESSLAFENTKEDYEETNISVTKVWNDDLVNHNPVRFRLIQETGGVESFYIDENGDSQFELSEGNWTKSFNHLVTKIGATSYTYRIVEDRMDGYKTDYPAPVKNGDTWEYKIVNTATNKVEINVEKKWTDQDGRELGENEIPVDSIDVTLKRQYKEYLTTVTIRILPNGNSQGVEEQEITTQAYLGGTLKFQMERIEGQADPVTVRYSSNCNCTISNGVINVTNIGENPLIVLYYDRYTKDDLIFYNTSGDDFNSWTLGNGMERGTPYSSSYTTGGISSLQAKNRTASWQSPTVNVDSTIFKKGNTYTIVGYVMARNSATISGASSAENLPAHSIPLNFYIRYTGGENRIGEYTISEEESTQHYSDKNYHKLQSVVTLPANPQDVRITLDTYGETSSEIEGSNYCTDLYIDDVAIMPGNGDINVATDGTITTTSKFTYKELSKTYPSNYGEWENDDGWSRTVSITKGSDGKWTYKFNGADLGEEAGRDYKYFIQEDTHLDGYQTTITSNGVSTNTTNSPIVITNQTNSYSLPLTGGEGTDRVRLIGIAIIVSSTFVGLLHKNKRKRRPREG